MTLQSFFLRGGKGGSSFLSLVTLDVPPMVGAKVQKILGYENLIRKGCLLKTCQVEVKMSFLVNIANFP